MHTPQLRALGTFLPEVGGGVKGVSKTSDPHGMRRPVRVMHHQQDIGDPSEQTW